MSIKAQFDKKKMRSEIGKYLRILRSEARDIVDGAVVTYAQHAALHTPPNIGSKEIEPKKYERIIIPLSKAVKMKRNREREEDIRRIRQGFRFKMFIKKPYQRRFRVFYFRELSEKADKETIDTRGLTRFAFGASIQQVLGRKIPINIRGLETKSPHLKRLRGLNQITKKDDGKTYSVTNRNLAIHSSSGFIAEAQYQGIKKARDYIRARERKVAKKSVKL